MYSKKDKLQMKSDCIQKNTQEGRVMDVLLKRGKITSIEAIQKLGNTRLSATIWTLRHAYDIPIETTYKTVKTRWGKKVSVGVYEVDIGVAGNMY